MDQLWLGKSNNILNLTMLILHDGVSPDTKEPEGKGDTITLYLSTTTALELADLLTKFAGA